MREGLRALRPDLVAFQEAIVTDDYDQPRDLLGGDFHFAHQRLREPDGSLAAEIQAPDPLGRLVFVNHIPSWQLDFEFERQVQTVAAAALVDEMLDGRASHVILAGDLDAEPTSASVRFLSGQQSLAGTSVRFRDTWAGDHFGVTAELSAVLRDGRPVP